MSRSDEWIHHWSAREVAELETALLAVRRTGRSLDRISRADFPLPSLANWLDGVRDELLRGRGFVLLRGLDIEKYTRDEIATIFWGIGMHLGRPRPQNARGHLLGHVLNLDLDSADPRVRIYQTRERQGFHTDSADLVGLLCLERALEGGRSALVACETLHNELLESSPQRLGELFQPFCTDHRGEHATGTAPYFTAPILSWYEEKLSVLYQRRYIESAQRFPDVLPLSEERIAALDALDRAADDPAIHLEMDLERGDLQFLHNHQMLHDRTAFRDRPESSRRRHLLRLWLCPPDGRPLPPWFAERLGSVLPGRRGGVALEGVDPMVSLEP